MRRYFVTYLFMILKLNSQDFSHRGDINICMFLKLSLFIVFIINKFFTQFAIFF